MFFFVFPFLVLMTIFPMILVHIYSKMGWVETSIGLEENEKRSWNYYLICNFCSLYMYPFLSFFPVIEHSPIFENKSSTFFYIVFMIVLCFFGSLVSTGSLYFTLWTFTPAFLFVSFHFFMHFKFVFEFYHSFFFPFFRKLLSTLVYLVKASVNTLLQLPQKIVKNLFFY